MELVIGKPNGAAISTAFCDSPCAGLAGQRDSRPAQARDAQWRSSAVGR